MEEKMHIDYERKQVTAPITSDGVKVIIISDGDAQCYDVPDFGEITVKTQGGHAGVIKTVSTYKWGEQQ
ncbi:XtrA/YqaO family protein [Sporolactobacillus putidus]|uniref:Uncharacterized protein n=1 Tax=Sporolactobacillus putidus TaxID=492735 RepID=A0A917W3F7_9BACL|nr:XtrA/YqaO family protein [Sporolactobacillus putidus]GGL58060.1 hypothetical protein GCM10007968_22570 [Sporolactobacillus putidus]